MNYYNPQTGYGYGATKPQARNTQPLTPEQIAKLRQDNNSFDMKVDQEDLWRAACTHKEKDGTSALISNNDGTYTCTICQKTFSMKDWSFEEVDQAVTTITDILQTLKAIYVDASDGLIVNYFQMLPLLEKLRELWKRGVKNFSMYENNNVATMNPMSPGYSGFAAVNNLLTNPYAGFNNFMAQQPMPQAMYGQPMPMNNGFYNPQPNMMNMQNGMNPNVGNPMAYGVPNVNPGMNQVPQVQQQQAPVPGVVPAPQPAPDNTNQAQTGEVQQQQVFNV